MLHIFDGHKQQAISLKALSPGERALAERGELVASPSMYVRCFDPDLLVSMQTSPKTPELFQCETIIQRLMDARGWYTRLGVAPRSARVGKGVWFEEVVECTLRFNRVQESYRIMGFDITLDESLPDWAVANANH